MMKQRLFVQSSSSCWKWKWEWGLTFHFQSFSTSTTSSVMDYLTGSLGFNQDEAVAVSSQVPHLKSTTNSASVVNSLKHYGGLNDPQVRNIVSIVPRILTIKPTKTLQPKLSVFHQLGLAGPDLVRLIKKNRTIFWKGLDTQINPTLLYLRTLLRGSDTKVVEFINRSKWMLLSATTRARISENILLLKDKHGLSDDVILKFLVNAPECMKQKPALFGAKLHYLQHQLGISPDSPIFLCVLDAIVYRSQSEIENNIQLFRTFGWSDHELAALLRSQPKCLSMSPLNTSRKLTFFMKELNYTPSYLIVCTNLWTLSLEKRVRPRNEMLKILQENELLTRNLSLITIVKYSESKFLAFLKKYESCIPNLTETYTRISKVK